MLYFGKIERCKLFQADNSDLLIAILLLLLLLHLLLLLQLLLLHVEPILHLLLHGTHLLFK